MAHSVEPMDIDNIESDFDNKENSIHHSNVYPRTPCTEKGYEELDVSELNMKLRYSLTPAASPMSKSYTANSADTRNLESGDDTLNANLTRSLHSAFSKGDSVNKSVKTLPLQSLSTEQLVDNSRNTSVLRQLDSMGVADNNVTVTITNTNDNDENISFPSSSSSTVQTPEAITPTKEIPREEGGSPIMRGLKSVLNMFRSSQSPIPPADNETVSKQADISSTIPNSSQGTVPVLASTPIAAHRLKEGSLSKTSSPHKESLVFNEDLEKELLWKDETTILFSQEKIPIHKLFFQQTPNQKGARIDNANVTDNLNDTVEYMDISYNNSILKNKTITDLQTEGLNESDGEFVDCETTFTNDNSGMAVVKDNKVTENEEQEPNTAQVLSTTDVIKNEVSVLPNESLKTDLPEVDDILVTSLAEKKGTIQIEPVESTQTENDVSADTVETIIKNEVSQNVDTTITKTNIEVENVIPESEVDRKVAVGSEISQNDKLPLNMTFETCQLPCDEIIFKPDSNIVNSTLALSESDVDKGVTNSTFVQQAESVPMVSDVCDSTYNKCEEITFVKHTVSSDVCNVTTNVIHENTTFIKELVPVPSDNVTTTIAPKVEDETFVKEIGNSYGVNIENATFVKDLENVTIPSNNSQSIAAAEDATFTTDTEVVPNVNNGTSNVGYNTFVHEIKNESGVDRSTQEKVNTSTPSAVIDVPESPENVPLPDEDDIENEKSLGASMLVEEKTIPASSDIYNTSVTELESENNVEEMPINIAKSIAVNSTINYPIQDREPTTVMDADNVVNPGELSDINTEKTCQNNEQEDKQIQQMDEFKSDVIIPQDVSMNINESIIVETQIESNISVHQNLDVSMGLASFAVDAVDKIPAITNIQENVAVSNVNNTNTENPDTITTKKLQLDVSHIIPSITDTEMLASGLSETQNIHPTSDMKTIDENGQVNELEIKVSSAEIKEVASDGNIIIEVADVKCEQNTFDATISETTGLTLKEVCVDGSTFNDNVEILPTCPIIANNEVDLPAEVEEITSGKPDEIEMDVQPTDKNKDKVGAGAENLVEEIVVSENNSPFVSVAGQIDDIPTAPLNYEQIEDPFASKTRVVLTPPSSPKIVSKGYNFNFDEIDDPFATKTKIRLSPALESSPTNVVHTMFEEKVEAPQRDMNKNRRKSQPARKKPLTPKKKLNSTFSGSVKATNTNIQNQEPSKNTQSKSDETIILSNEKETSQLPENITENLDFDKQPQTLDVTMNVNIPISESSVPELSVDEVPKEQKSLDDRDVDTTTEAKIIVENKCSIESLNVATSETKTTSSSDQSAYYSAGSSSGESTSKNVFNIPEIDDMNFNPFITKSKMRQSPPPDIVESETPNMAAGISNTTITEVCKDDLAVEENKVQDTVDEKEGADVSNTTCSSKATDEKDLTVREVNTEDEDTEEGPFFENDDNDKMSDFDGDDVDMMQFSELPPQNNEEKVDNGEMFIDAEAFEFLLNQNKSNVVSDSGKESLFLKFDPLFAKRISSDGVLAALNKVQKRQSTPKKMAPPAPLQMDSTFAVAGPSKLNVTHDVEANTTTEEIPDDLNVTVSKPMMVVTPAINPVVTPRNKTTTPISSNRRSITFTSPAIAVIDRLLSLSANNSLMGHDTTVTVSREQNEADLALTQLRELLAEKEISVYNLRSETKELKDRLSSLESQMRTLEAESEGRLKKVNDLNEKLSEKTKINKSMAAVVEEYERTIASLIAETEQDKKRNNEERIKLIQERDEQTAHLASMEVSFSDLHSKYEKSKQIILTCKANEDAYKKSIKDFEENLTKMQSNYELLKQHATSKLNHANQELEKMNRAHESEVLKMNAMIKRKELHITSLEETLAQKTKANEELTAICDELINKVG